jgi:hypothetical protein
MSVWNPVEPGGIRLGNTRVEVWYEGADSQTPVEFTDRFTLTRGGPPFGIWYGNVLIGRAALVEDAKKVAIQFESNLRELGIDTSV